jgi:hypothetical protein
VHHDLHGQRGLSTANTHPTRYNNPGETRLRIASVFNNMNKLAIIARSIPKMIVSWAKSRLLMITIAVMAAIPGAVTRAGMANGKTAIAGEDGGPRRVCMTIRKAW